MHLELLCEMDFSYRREELYDNEPFKYVVPYGSQEASLYGEGEAAFLEPRLRGTSRFVNHARRRGDGVNLPTVDGILRTEDGPFVLWRVDGRTPPPVDGKRRLLASVLFEAEDQRYARLNTALCVLEGELRSGGITHTRIYLCEADLE